MAKCRLNINENGDVTGVSIPNPTFHSKEEYSDVRKKLLDRQTIEARVGEKFRKAINVVKSESNSESVEKEIQEVIAERWAKRNNFWVEDYINNNTEYGTQGEKHIVYVDPLNTSKLIKVNYNYENLEDLHKEISDYNNVFPETAYKVIGFTKLKDDYGQNATKGKFGVVLEQNFIPNKEEMSESNIDTYFKSLGFENNDGVYENGNISIYNINPNSVFKSNEQVYVVDAYVELNGELEIEEDIKEDPSEISSVLFDEISKIPLLNNGNAVSIYRESFSKKFTDWDKLDFNC